jgi:hypothetical protein
MSSLSMMDDADEGFVGLMGDLREAPRLNNQSNRVSILRMGTSKDRSAKLWIIAEPAFSCLDYPVINSPVH